MRRIFQQKEYNGGTPMSKSQLDEISKGFHGQIMVDNQDSRAHRYRHNVVSKIFYVLDLIMSHPDAIYYETNLCFKALDLHYCAPDGQKATMVHPFKKFTRRKG